MVKRKVARIGPSTLMISLPSKWCKHFNIQKGAELDVEEQGSEIKIRVNENKSLLETTVDISNLGYRTGKWTLGIPFTAGYDLINVNHEENQKDFINSIIREEFIGFIISEQNDNKTVFKKVTMESEEEFDALLRRVFLLTIDLSQKVVTALNESKPSALKNYLVMEKTNNQLVNHCFRLLVKSGYKDYKKTDFYHVVVWNLEKLADEFKYMINYFQNKKLDLNKELIDILREIQEIFQQYYETFYSFSLDKLDKLTVRNKELQDIILGMEKKLSKEDTVLTFFMIKLLDRLDNFSSSFVAINLKQHL